MYRYNTVHDIVRVMDRSEFMYFEEKCSPKHMRGFEFEKYRKCLSILGFDLSKKRKQSLKVISGVKL